LEDVLEREPYPCDVDDPTEWDTGKAECHSIHPTSRALHVSEERGRE
jgi:hypothetical protein